MRPVLLPFTAVHTDSFTAYNNNHNNNSNNSDDDDFFFQ